MHDSDFSIEKALEARKEARLNRKTFVLTNGCFDILHAGHASSLIQARSKVNAAQLYHKMIVYFFLNRYMQYQVHLFSKEETFRLKSIR